MDTLRERIQAELSSPALFGFDIPKLEVPLDKFDATSLSQEELDGLIKELGACDVFAQVNPNTGRLELSGSQESLVTVPTILQGFTDAKRYDGLVASIKEYMQSDAMTEFNRDLVALKRELKGFDSIKFKMQTGRCIVQTDHGLEDI